jgi:hypothetical protein
MKMAFIFMKAICSPNWIRTNGRRFRKPVLYPAELWDLISNFYRGLENRCSLPAFAPARATAGRYPAELWDLISNFYRGLENRCSLPAFAPARATAGKYGTIF